MAGELSLFLITEISSKPEEQAEKWAIAQSWAIFYMNITVIAF